MSKLNHDRVQVVLDGKPGAIVGNNRAMSRVGEEIHCTLHGSVIMKKIGNTLVFDPCGFFTITTGRAMADFAKVFGVDLKASFAKNEFKIRRGSAIYIPDWSGRISLTI